MFLRLNVDYPIRLNDLSYLSHLLKITCYSNNKFWLLEPSPKRRLFCAVMRELEKGAKLIHMQVKLLTERIVSF